MTSRPVYTRDLLPHVLARRALETPDQVFVEHVDGAPCTFADVHALGDRFASAFLTWGIAPGDRVLTMLPPRVDWLGAWIGLARCRAIDVGVNTEFRGEMLRYALHTAQARLLLVAAEYLDRFDRELLDGCGLEGVVIVHGDGVLPGIPSQRLDEFLPAAPRPDIDRDAPDVWNVACMILTSGTTGPSKYVLCPWGLVHSGTTGFIPLDDLGPDDALYLPLPTYHLSARLLVCLIALVGGRAVLRDRFSLGSFWDDVGRYRCTIGMVAFFAQLLLDEPSRPDDADNPLRGAFMAPLHPRYEEFAARFGVRICTGYGGTELGAVITAGWDPVNGTTCGRERVEFPGVHLRIVDEHDNPVPDGEFGELIVRTDDPWTLMAGYFGMPAATAAAWRNGWFHTGDGFRRDEDGNLYFTDRIKDAIRRRGENISSFEIEREVTRHPDVLECAAVAVRQPGEEDEVMIVVVPRPGTGLTPQSLWADLVPRLPRFMVPRYIELIDELPKTAATNRTRKIALRERGVTRTTWDRATDDSVLRPVTA